MSNEEYEHDLEAELEKSKELEESHEVDELNETDSSEEKSATYKGEPNVTLTSDYQINDEKGNDEMRLTLPSVTLSSWEQIYKDFKKTIEDMVESNKSTQKSFEMMIDAYTPGGLYQKRFQEEGDFQQGVDVGDGVLKTMSALNFKETTGEIRGDAALLKIAKYLRLGETIDVPLPHSGIWVTMKPPTERDLIDFYNSFFSDKEILGRNTSGHTLGNMSVIFNTRLYDFILRHIHTVNYKDLSMDELRSKILIHDFPILVWGMARSIHPNGFDYQRICLNDVGNCNHIEKAKLNLNKLLLIDNSSLTSKQKTIMGSNRPNQLTRETYESYISDHSRVKSSTFAIELYGGRRVVIRLKVPTLDEYMTDGARWVNEINNTVEAALVTSGESENARLELLNHHVRASLMNQYVHFIDQIEVGNNIITDNRTISDTLSLLTGDDSVRELFNKKILEFKEDTTLAIIGIPEYKCPKCQTSQAPDKTNSVLTNVIPIDVVHLAFLMLTSRISTIVNRDV